MTGVGGVDLPEEVTESEHQNAHTSELNNIGKVALERLHQIAEHGCQGQRPDTHDETGKDGHEAGAEFPVPVPVLSWLSAISAIRRRIQYGK